MAIAKIVNISMTKIKADIIDYRSGFVTTAVKLPETGRKMMITLHKKKEAAMVFYKESNIRDVEEKAKREREATCGNKRSNYFQP